MPPHHERQALAPRRGAIGKALIVWLVSGSFGLGLLALILFAMMGC